MDYLLITFQKQHHYNLPISQTMAEENDNLEARSNKTSLTLHSSTSKEDVQVRQSRKKKMIAFQTFLEGSNQESILEDLPRRHLSSLQQDTNTCGICKQYLTQQSRLCEFCGMTVCLSHFHKRRRNNNTNKWARICQPCEDKYLMHKYYQSEMKTEESLTTQELILQDRLKQTQTLFKNRQTQLEMILIKRKQIEESYQREMVRFACQNQELNKKFTLLLDTLKEQKRMEAELNDIEKKMPPSLEADFEFLTSENARITKELTKHEKLCVDAVKSRSQREKEMYREYYEWQQQKRREMQVPVKQQQQECSIY